MVDSSIRRANYFFLPNHDQWINTFKLMPLEYLHVYDKFIAKVCDYFLYQFYLFFCIARRISLIHMPFYYLKYSLLGAFRLQAHEWSWSQYLHVLAS